MKKKRDSSGRVTYVLIVMFLIVVVLFSVSNFILGQFGMFLNFEGVLKGESIFKNVEERLVSGEKINEERIMLHNPIGGFVPEFSTTFGPVDIADLNLFPAASITSITSGNWEDESTWDQNRIPQIDDVVEIRHEDSVILSSTTPDLEAVNVHGDLIFSRTTNTILNVGYVLIDFGHSGFDSGVVDMGTQASPIPKGVTAEIHFRAIPATNYFEELGPGMTVLGTFNSHGESIPETFVRMSDALPSAGASQATLETDVSTDWNVGDRVVIPASRVIDNELETGSETEERIIQNIVSNGDGTSTITFDTPLTYPHPDGCQWEGPSDPPCKFKPHIALLTRNIKVTSDPTGSVSCGSGDSTGNRGTISILDSGARFNAYYTEFNGLGRPFNLGNSAGRYALHFHHLHEAAQFSNLIGNSIWDTHSVGIRIHHTDFLTVRDNVLYDTFGYGMAHEEGNENGNVIDHNIIMKVPGCGNRPAHNEGVSLGKQENGIGIFFMNPMNRIINNVVSGGAARSDYAIDLVPSQQLERVYNLDGSFTNNVDVNQQPILEFDGNENYGDSYNTVGMDIWHIRTQREKSYITNHVFWNGNGQTINYPTYNLVYDGYIGRNCRGGPGLQRRGQGFGMDDYEEVNMELSNFDIRGCADGVSVEKNNKGYFVLRDSYFEGNARAITITGKNYNNVGSHNSMNNRNNIFKNIRFSNNDLNIESTRSNPNHDYFNLDRFYFIDYDGVTGDNFEFFTMEGFTTSHFYGPTDLCQKTFWGCNLLENGGHYNPSSMPTCSGARNKIGGFACDFDIPSTINSCKDNDGDGFGEGCGYYRDCDDDDPLRHPNMPELCGGDMIDNNCDGRIGQDNDGDGYGVYCSLGSDANDGDPNIGLSTTPTVDSCGEDRRVLEMFINGPQVFSGNPISVPSDISHEVQEFTVEARVVWNPPGNYRNDVYNPGYAIVAHPAITPYLEAFAISIDRSDDLKLIFNNREFIGPKMVPGIEYHIAVTRTALGNIKLYIDGILVLEGEDTRPLLYADTWILGARKRTADLPNTHRQFQGTIENFVLYDEALNPGEVSAHANIGICASASCTSDIDGDNYGPGCPLGLDCNDFEFEVNPGANEIAGDGIDNDCDLLIDECGNGQKSELCDDEIPIREIIIPSNPISVLDETNIHFFEYARRQKTGIMQKDKWNQVNLDTVLPSGAVGVILQTSKPNTDTEPIGNEARINIKPLQSIRIGGVAGRGSNNINNLFVHEKPTSYASYYTFAQKQKNVEYRGDFYYSDIPTDLKMDVLGYFISNSPALDEVTTINSLTEQQLTNLGNGGGSIDLSNDIPVGAKAAYVIVSIYNNGATNGEVRIENQVSLGFMQQQHITTHLISVSSDRNLDYIVSGVSGNDVSISASVSGYITSSSTGTTEGQLYLYNDPIEIYEGFGLKDSGGWQTIDSGRWIPAGAKAALVTLEYQGGQGGEARLSSPSNIGDSFHQSLISTGESHQAQVFLVSLDQNQFMFDVIDTSGNSILAENEPYLRMSLQGYVSGPSDLCGTSDQQCVYGSDGPIQQACGTDLDGIGICSQGTLTLTCSSECRRVATTACENGYQGPVPESNMCSDGLDNNCNGLIDLQDPACESINPSICGDGNVEGAEICDDGNINIGDGCDSQCQIEPGWNCDSNGCFLNLDDCGDGAILGLEACDDGSVLEGDGCDNRCQIEPGWECTGEPSICTDVVPPTVLSVFATENTLSVIFSERVDSISAQDISNYGINGISISGAVLQPDDKTIILNTATHIEGQSYTLTTGGVRDINGNIMSTSEQSIYSLFAGCNDPTLKLYLPLDNNANDLSQYGNDGTVNGALSTTGLFGGAYSFDGIDDIIRVSNSNSLNIVSDQLSISLWAKGGSQEQYRYLVSKSPGSGTSGYSIYTGGSGLLNTFIGDGSNLIITLPVTGVFSWDDQWHHIVSIYDRDTLSLYVDGQLLTGISTDVLISDSSTFDLTIGAHNSGGFPFSGEIDEVVVYERALTAQEIFDLGAGQVCGGGGGVCGDGSLDAGEICECGADGICGNLDDNVNGNECSDVGSFEIGQGTLSCLGDCTGYDVSSCIAQGQCVLDLECNDSISCTIDSCNSGVCNNDNGGCNCGTADLVAPAGVDVLDLIDTITNNRDLTGDGNSDIFDLSYVATRANIC